MRQQPYNLHYQQITNFYYQILWLKYWYNLQQDHPAQTLSSVLRQPSSERKFANGAATGAFSKVFGSIRSNRTSSDGTSPVNSRLEKNSWLSKRRRLRKTGNSLTFNLTASHDPAISSLTADEYFDQIEKSCSLSVDGKSITVNIDVTGVEESQGRFKSDLHLQMCVPSICSSGLGAAEGAGRRIWYSSVHLMLTPTHEFGHILGFMDNVAGGRGSIMGPGSFKPPLIRSVTPDDFNEIYNLYNN